MLRTMLSGKIHRAVVTDADLHYVGSVTLDATLMAAAGVVEGEQVHLVDVTNGARLVTYAITGAAGSGVVCVNGAAAHLVRPGDLVIVLSYALLDDAEVAGWTPRVVHVDARNRVLATGTDPAAPVPVATGGPHR